MFRIKGQKVNEISEKIIPAEGKFKGSSSDEQEARNKPPRKFSRQTAPNTLSAESRRLWREICKDYSFDLQALCVLKTSLESLDQYNDARRQLRREGTTVKGMNGILKEHPAAKIMRESRAGYYQGWKLLNLDLVAVGPNGRPPGS